MNQNMRLCLLGAAAAVMLSGCQGPETRVIPRQTVSQEHPYELNGTDTVPEEVNPLYLQEMLGFLAASPRICASPEETNAAEFIKRLLLEYGYDVTIQRFPVSDDTGSQYGTNVIAVKEAAAAEGDILLVTTNHDTVPDSPGANDNASGVVAFLETARLIARMPTDTQLRFVSLSGMSVRQQGIDYYLNTLTDQERQRIIGAIHLDTLGYMYDHDIVMGTVDGSATLLGDLLSETAERELEQGWYYQMDDWGGSCPAFEHYRIPAVRVTQNIAAFEQGTQWDRPDIIDVDKIIAISQVLSRTMADIMAEDTPSFLKASREDGYDRDGVLLQRVGQSIPFGETRKTVENYYGSAGGYLDLGQREGQLYQYPMKWLGVDQIILSGFLYQNDILTGVILEADAAGITANEMKQRLNRQYGEPQESAGETAGVPVLRWNDYAARLVYKIQEWPEGYTVMVAAGRSAEIEFSRFSVSRLKQGDAVGTTADEEPLSVREKAVLELTEQILRPKEREKIAAIALFTDGIGGRQVYWTDESDGRPVLHIDLEDMTDPEGNYRQYTESCKQLVKAYTYFYDREYGRLFYETFDQTIGDEFEDAFQMFVLTNKPQGGETDADAEIIFFYQYEPLITVRNDIRWQLGLPL